LIPAAGASHPLRTGLYLGTDGAADDLAYTRARAAGTSMVRLPVRWSEIAPKVPSNGFQAADEADPAYRWVSIDAQVELAAAHGLQPLLTVYEPPAWAESKPGPQRTGAVDADAFAKFGAAIATRYDGNHGEPRVQYWEVWNEPNVNIYLSPQFAYGKPASPAAYRTLLNAFANAVHRVLPGNVVVAGGLSPFTVNSGSTVTIGPLRFMRALLCMSGGAHPHATCHTRVEFDAWSSHPYTSGGPTHSAINPNDVSLGDLPKMRNLLDAAYKAGQIASSARPGFWVTEFSWDSSPPDPKGVPLALHARWTEEALYRMWQAGVSVVIWLQLYDDVFPGSPLQAGLYFRSGGGTSIRPKPALTAFTFPFVAYLNGNRVSLWARTPLGQSKSVVIERRVGSTWKHVVTVRADGFGIVEKTIGGRFTKTDRLRARIGQTSSLAFSLTQPPDRSLNPFGT
jgi:hypothetical protein